MLRELIYRDIQRVNCLYKNFVQYSLPSMKDLNAMPRKDARKLLCMSYLQCFDPKEIILLLLFKVNINLRG